MGTQLFFLIIYFYYMNLYSDSKNIECNCHMQSGVHHINIFYLFLIVITGHYVDLQILYIPIFLYLFFFAVIFFLPSPSPLPSIQSPHLSNPHRNPTFPPLPPKGVVHHCGSTFNQYLTSTLVLQYSFVCRGSEQKLYSMASVVCVPWVYIKWYSWRYVVTSWYSLRDVGTGAVSYIFITFIRYVCVPLGYTFYTNVCRGFILAGTD